MDELAALRVFIQAVETDSLAAADFAQGMTPSSIAHCINELDENSGPKQWHVGLRLGSR